MKEDEFPALYTSADINSARAQKAFLGALIVSLSCLVVAAILSTLNIPNPWFAGAQIAVLLASLFLTIYMATGKPQRIWYGSRALAESVKTVSWRYMMRAEPFNVPDVEARKHFVGTLRKILEDNKSITAQAGDIHGNGQITPKMEEIRQRTIGDRIGFYTVNRIDDQHAWYRKKARFNRRRATWWFVAIIVLNLFAISFSIWRLIDLTVERWPTDVLVTAAGAVMAWLQTKRYQELAASYALTAHEIGLMREILPNDGKEKSFSDFVGDAENAFSREHTQWQARRDQD